MFRTFSRTVLVALGIVLLTGSWSTGTLAGGQALATADAKTWMGEWALTVLGGRGSQERQLTIKDMGGKVVATLGGGRGGPIEITDVSKKGNDVVLKFKHQGRGGEADVLMTLSMQGAGTLTVKNEVAGNAQTGTGNKKV